MSNTASVTPYDSESTGTSWSGFRCLRVPGGRRCRGSLARGKNSGPRSCDRGHERARKGAADRRGIAADLRWTAPAGSQHSALHGEDSRLPTRPGSANRRCDPAPGCRRDSAGYREWATGRLVVHSGTARVTQALLCRHTLDQVRRGVRTPGHRHARWACRKGRDSDYWRRKGGPPRETAGLWFGPTSGGTVPWMSTSPE